MSQNLVEKIVQRFAVGLDAGHLVRAGEYVSIRPAHVLTHDNTSAVIPKFTSLGAARVADPRQPVFALDHDIQNTSEATRGKYQAIAAFAQAHGIDFYPAGRGIGHQIMCEEGYAWPGALVVASDSHANMYGGLGCLGTPVVRSDAAALWATGCTWWQVPPVARVTLTGRLRPGVTGKDVIVTLCGAFSEDQVLNHAIEFDGDGVAALSLDERLTIANMTTEWGALAGVFPVDDVTIAWLEARAARVAGRGLAGVPSDADGGGRHPRLDRDRIASILRDAPRGDRDANYEVELTLDLSTVQPYVSGPNTVKVARPAAELAREAITIHRAYLVSCVNSRAADLALAAQVLRGRRVAPGVRFYIAAASSEVQADSERSGDWAALLEAGAHPLPPGCGPCIGLGEGLLEDGEVGISATNRNFTGRMGSPKAQVYLASPAVVAASAAAGVIAVPEGYDAAIEAPRAVARPRRGARAREAVRLIEGFPSSLAGDVVFCHQDNLNTDGIYPGKYTYRDDISAEEQARVVMENYDPAFRDLARRGDLLVGGFNFGTGSSREQAATALKHAGIQAVLAGSFNETYKRNALNNGLLVIEAPELVRDLKARFGTAARTVRTGLRAEIDVSRSVVRVERVGAGPGTTVGEDTYGIDPIGIVAQELIRAGGLEGWIKDRMKN
jgi:homoaconitate hydratase